MPTGARVHPQLGGAATGSSGPRAGPSVGRPTAANTDRRRQLPTALPQLRGDAWGAVAGTNPQTRCPSCAAPTSVVAVEVDEHGSAVRRRRRCSGCDLRFITLERYELVRVAQSGIFTLASQPRATKRP
ncbi:hypothetical protein [Streptomyces canus]|uniref:NrdR family transcriptional regulator n=1 Tax=Streptomyces canus TaxID=58343 RepID=UPI003AF2A2CC